VEVTISENFMIILDTKSDLMISFKVLGELSKAEFVGNKLATGIATTRNFGSFIKDSGIVELVKEADYPGNQDEFERWLVQAMKKDGEVRRRNTSLIY
jgi:hypothetical protein